MINSLNRWAIEPVSVSQWNFNHSAKENIIELNLQAERYENHQHIKQIQFIDFLNTNIISEKCSERSFWVYDIECSTLNYLWIYLLCSSCRWTWMVKASTKKKMRWYQTCARGGWWKKAQIKFSFMKILRIAEHIFPLHNLCNPLLL
mgnify:CR=1 FL=1